MVEDVLKLEEGKEETREGKGNEGRKKNKKFRAPK